MGARRLNNKLNIVSINLYKYRRMRQMSQSDICRELALIGVTLYNNDIYKIEHNKRTVKDYELYAFSKVLNIGVEQLLENAEENFTY